MVAFSKLLSMTISKILINLYLTLIWGSFWGWGGGVKLTTKYAVSENIPFSTKAVLILLMSAFFWKSQRFLAKILLLLKAIVWELF